MATLRDIRTEATRRKMTVMQAYLDGKVIETRSHMSGEVDWHVIDYPTWNWNHFDYRVKEETNAAP